VCSNGVVVSGGSGPGISLTTIGTSGAATLTGTVLNIPIYAPTTAQVQFAINGQAITPSTVAAGSTVLSSSGPGIVGEGIIPSPVPIQSGLGIQNVIIDNDIGADHDADFEMALAFRAADQGLINIVAETVVGDSASYSNVAYCRVLDYAVLNTYYGYPNIPIGIGSSPNIPGSGNANCRALPTVFPAPFVQTQDAVTLLRTALASYPNGSITLVTGGPLTNILALYNSAADSISPLTGAQLIAAKIGSIVAIVGGFPSSTPWAGNNQNCTLDITACQLLNSLTVPIIYPGIETYIDGVTVDAPGSPIKLISPYASPVALSSYSDNYTTYAGDPESMLYAAWGLSYNGTANYTLSAGGHIVVDGSGQNTWSTSGVTNQHYLIRSVTAAALTATISAASAYIPINPTPTTRPTAAGAVSVGPVVVNENLPTATVNGYTGTAGLLTHLTGKLALNPAFTLSDLWSTYPATVTNIGPVAVQNPDYMTFNAASYAVSALPLTSVAGTSGLHSVSMAIVFRVPSAGVLSNARLMSLGDFTNGNGNSFSMQITTSGLKGILSDSSTNTVVTSYANISANTWHVAQLDYTGTTTQTLVLYLDGVQQSSVSTTSAPTGLDLRRPGLNIGSYLSGLSEYFNGDIASAAVWAGNPIAYQVYQTMMIPDLPVVSSHSLTTLSSGTKTVNDYAACSPSSTCVYSFTNCGPNSSTAIGTLSLGTVVLGTSFVVNSLGPLNTVLTGDSSYVCFRIN
jgi:hypothetical protein